MRYDKYKFKFYLNASHSIYIGGVLGERHPHTWEFSLDVMQVLEGFVQFNNIEKEYEKVLAKYQDQYLNMIEPFNTINPTLEKICEYFKDRLKQLSNDMGLILMSIEISETPSRSYIIDLIDEVDFTELESSNEEKENSNLDKIVDEVLDNILDDRWSMF